MPPTPRGVVTAGAPLTSLFPSALNATAQPSNDPGTEPFAMRLGPCWLHVYWVRVNTQTAPLVALPQAPPLTSVFPSELSATNIPRVAAPPVPVSRRPCCDHVVPLLMYTH